MRTVAPSGTAWQGALASLIADFNAATISYFVSVCTRRSGAIATSSPSCNSQRPSRPSAQARNSSTVINGLATVDMPAGYHVLASSENWRRALRSQPKCGVALVEVRSSQSRLNRRGTTHFQLYQPKSRRRPGADDRLDAAYPVGDRGFHSGTEGGRHLRPGVERHSALTPGLYGRRRREIPPIAREPGDRSGRIGLPGFGRGRQALELPAVTVRCAAQDGGQSPGVRGPARRHSVPPLYDSRDAKLGIWPVGRTRAQLRAGVHAYDQAVSLGRWAHQLCNDWNSDGLDVLVRAACGAPGRSAL